MSVFLKLSVCAFQFGAQLCFLRRRVNNSAVNGERLNLASKTVFLTVKTTSLNIVKSVDRKQLSDNQLISNRVIGKTAF